MISPPFLLSIELSQVLCKEAIPILLLFRGYTMKGLKCHANEPKKKKKKDD